MKIFKVNFKWDPSCTESAIVAAPDKEVALELIKVVGYNESKVEGVEEINTEEEKVIYAGYYCC